MGTLCGMTKYGNRAGKLTTEDSLQLTDIKASVTYDINVLMTTEPLGSNAVYD